LFISYLLGEANVYREGVHQLAEGMSRVVRQADPLHPVHGADRASRSAQAATDPVGRIQTSGVGRQDVQGWTDGERRD